MNLYKLIIVSLLLPLNFVWADEAAVTDEAAMPETAAMTEEQQQMLSEMRDFWNSLNRQTGEIQLLDGVATLNVPEKFYFLNATDAEKVLVNIWGNPPSASTLGMLFPAETTPFDEHAWAVTIQYEEDGYVSDKDADDINYAELLTQMQDDVTLYNDERVAQGYDSIKLVGWASSPFYDKAAHKLHWAKELEFSNDPNHTLNYNIRILGRKGVLILNFIAAMDQQTEIESQLDSVLAVADFSQGSRYDEFNPDLDKIAAYGIGALVAGKVLAKAGFFVAALIFLKKFGIIFVIAVGAFISKFLKRKKANAPT